MVVKKKEKPLQKDSVKTSNIISTCACEWLFMRQESEHDVARSAVNDDKKIATGSAIPDQENAKEICRKITQQTFYARCSRDQANFN